MKYLVLLIIVGLFSVQETEAKPFIITDIIGGITDAIGGVVDVAGNIAGGAINAAGNIAGGILQVSVDAVTGAIEIGTGIGSSLVKGAQGFAVASLQTIKQVTVSIDQVLTEQIDSFKSKVLQRAVTEFQDKINGMQSEIEKLSKMAKDKLDEANKKSEEFVAEKEEDWAAWGDKLQEQLANSTDDAKQEGKDQVDAFIEASRAEIEDCTKSITDKAEKVSEKASDAVNKFLPPINAVLAKIQECSTISVKDVKGTAACAKEIREEFKPLISAPATILKLSVDLGKASLGSVQSLTCVPKTMAQIEKNKKEVAKAIAELAKQKEETTEEENTGEGEQPEEEENTGEEQKPEEEENTGEDQQPEEGGNPEEEVEPKPEE